MPDNCPICDELINFSTIGNTDIRQVQCPRCGDYQITRTALVNLRGTDFSYRNIPNISGWLRENPGFQITTANVENLLKLTRKISDRKRKNKS